MAETNRPSNDTRVKRCRKWDYTTLMPLFRASGYARLDWFKKVIIELEEGLSGG